MVYLPSFNAKMSFCALDVQCTNFFKGANSARTFKKIGALCIQSPERHVGVGGGGGKVHHFRFMTAMAMACTSLIAQKATMCVEALRFEWFSYCY